MPTDTQSGGANTKGAINQGKSQDGNFKVAPEDRVAPADRQELADDEPPADDSNQEPSFPARVNVTVEKPGNGCLHFETLAQDGMIMIENVFFYKNTKLADAGTAELDWTRRNVYAGPPFANLDEELQVLLERYLEERGIDTAMALWVPEYVDFKEQKEYIGWLSSKFASVKCVIVSTDIAAQMSRSSLMHKPVFNQKMYKIPIPLPDFSSFWSQ